MLTFWGDTVPQQPWTNPLKKPWFDLMLNHPSIHPSRDCSTQTADGHHSSALSYLVFWVVVVFLFSFLFSLFLQIFFVSRQSVTPEMFFLISLFFPLFSTTSAHGLYNQHLRARLSIRNQSSARNTNSCEPTTTESCAQLVSRKQTHKAAAEIAKQKRFYSSFFFLPARRTRMLLMEALREYQQHLPTAFQGGQQQPLLLSATTATTTAKPPPSPFFFIKSWQRRTCGSEDDDRRKRMNERKKTREIENGVSGEEKRKRRATRRDHSRAMHGAKHWRHVVNQTVAPGV